MAEKPQNRSAFAVGFYGGLGLIAAYVLFLAVRDALGVLILVFVAAFLAIGLNPAVQWLQARGIPRWGAVSVVTLAIMLLATASILAVVPPIVAQGSALITNMPDYLDTLSRHRTLHRLDEQFHFVERAKGALTAENVGMIASRLFGGISLIFSTILGVLTTLFLTIFFIAAFERLERGFYSLIPLSRRERAKELGDQILIKVGWYMFGSLLIALLAGTLAAIFMTIVGIPYAFALAVVVAVLDLIPMVGATVAAVIVSLVGFTVSIPVGIASVIFFVVYQQVENWIITPPVMNRAVRISNLAAIVSALVGAALLGVVGALIAIPVWAAIQLMAREIILPYQNRH
jgi:predicted PurR-regulated permease PerM